jgi:AraC family transcriptional regulator of adaptative response/methylated-DNA-[protein]-cysteine methyltransferase
MQLTSPPPPDRAWRALLQRDGTFDGRFVYGVTSTRIFCRPSCPSRHPRRDRVRFFAGPPEATAAGFRACKRCKPTSDGVSDAERGVERARAFLDAHADERVSLARLAKEAGVSAAHLQRTFKRIMGLSPREYSAARRRDRLRTALRSEGSVSRATFEAGYGSSSRVYERAHALLGMTPATYRKGGAGMEIRYTIVPSAYGRLLVGATDKGVAAVALGDSDTALVRELAGNFPDAVRTRVDDGDDWLTGLVTRVAAAIKGPNGSRRKATPIPVDLAGTAFQWRVWKALTTIPAGETRTYQQLARSLGKPRAVRAVASACAANRLAVVVPCHRVIRTDGSLGGYRWGLPRKAALLEQERAMVGCLPDGSLRCRFRGSPRRGVLEFGMKAGRELRLVQGIVRRRQIAARRTDEARRRIGLLDQDVVARPALQDGLGVAMFAEQGAPELDVPDAGVHMVG